MLLRITSALTITFATALLVIASPNSIDPTFGVGGVSRSPVGKVSNDQAWAAALQPDGKVVAVGDTISDNEYSGEPANLFVIRSNADGSRDTGFGVNGVVVKRLRTLARGTSVVIQNDGKILVGGYIITEPSPGSFRRKFLFLRLLSSGDLDTSFGSNGVVITSPDTNQHATLTQIALQSDGKIVATGFTGISSMTAPHMLIVTRYNADGSPDTSFDGDGSVLMTVNPTGNRGNAVAIQSDGKIIVGGSVKEETSTITDFLVVRLNADGSPDTSFDGDGRVITKITTSTSVIAALGIQPDGKVVAAGNSTIGTNRNIALARYNSNGSPDSSFDGDGMVVTDVFDEQATSMAIQGDGKILVGGLASTGVNMPFDFLASRYETNGAPDTTFDGDGRATTNLFPGTDRANSLLLQPDGRIFLAGSTTDFTDPNIGFVRHNSNGSLDGTFDNDGFAIWELANAGDGIYDTAVQPDGKIVAVGYAFNGIRSRAAVSRFSQNGDVDTSFGTQGSFILSIPNLDFEADVFSRSVAIQSDGKILFSITAYTTLPYFAAVRLNADGTLDNSFGNGGIATVSITTQGDNPTAMALQSDGKVVIVGTVFGPMNGPALVRLNSNGTPDTTFGGTGWVVTTDGSIGIYAVDIQPDGKIVISGTKASATPNDNSFFTSRYNTNGSLDTTFNGTGSVTTSVGLYDAARTVKIQPDNKIVVAGYAAPQAAIIRYNANGSLDNTFDGDGKVSVEASGGIFYDLSDVATQPDGKLVLSGSQQGPLIFSGLYEADAAVFRFNANGSPDMTFGTGGKLIHPIGDLDSYHFSINVLPNGRILAGGLSSNGLNDDFTVARYVGAAGNDAPFDFDGDGKTDIGIFRPNVAEWWINRSSDGNTFATQFGAPTDKIVPADYTGDGKSDVAFWRPSSGEWYVLRSEDFSFFAFPFGSNGDIPVPADYDADGKADAAVFRPSSATWFIRRSSDGGTTIEAFGANGDIPVPADYDGDGKADLAIFRPTVGQWWINRSTAGLIATTFGDSAVKPVQGDYTGDGKSDVAFWRPSTGDWFVLRSEDFSFYSFPFGTTGDVPAPGDYDGDGKFDATVFRGSNATWYSNRTTGGTLIQQFGADGDRPIPNAFVP